MDSPAFSGEQDGCGKRREGQICGSESLLNQKPATVTQALLHFLKDTSHTAE